MNWIDILIILIFAYNVITGFSNGFLKTIFNIGAFFAALFFAPVIEPYLTSFMEQYLSDQQELKSIVGLGLSWFIIYVGCGLAFSLINKGVEKSPLNLINKIWGMNLGILISIVIVVTPYLIINSMPKAFRELPQVEKNMGGSSLLPYFKPLANPVKRIFKENLERQSKDLLNKLKNQNDKSKN